MMNTSMLAPRRFGANGAFGSFDHYSHTLAPSSPAQSQLLTTLRSYAALGGVLWFIGKALS